MVKNWPASRLDNIRPAPPPQPNNVTYFEGKYFLLTIPMVIIFFQTLMVNIYF